MPKSLGTLFTELAIKAGVKADDKSLKLLLENLSDAAKTEMPDDLLATMEGNLHTIESAKPKLKATLFAEALNGADTEIDRIMNELAMDDAAKAEITGEKSTHKKIGLLTKKISELEAKKAGAKGGDKQQLIDEINTLKSSLAAANVAKDQEIARLQSQHEDQLTTFEFRNNLSGYNYAFPETIDKRIQVDTVLNTINQSMTSDGVKVTRKDGQLVLVSAKDGSEYFDKSNNKKDLKSYTEQVLAQNNLLKATDTPPGGNGGNPPRTTILPGTAGSINQKSFMDAIESQIKEAQAQ